MKKSELKAIAIKGEDSRLQFKQDIPESPDTLGQLLQNMNLATIDGRLNLAGVLLFAERPEWIVPQFVIKAVR